MKVYLDACAIVYAHEGCESLRAAVAAWVGKAASDGEVMTSSLSRLECTVKPLRERDEALLAVYTRFFQRRSLRTVLLSDAVLDRAALLRASLRIKTPDALHLASAIVAQADVFVTGDVALQQCKDVNVVLVP